MDILGRNLNNLRKARGYTMPELAERAGIAQSYISRIENGVQKPRLEVVEKLAAALGTTPEALFRDNVAIPNAVIERLPVELQEWLLRKDVEPYLHLGKFLYDQGIPAEKARKIIETIETLIKGL